MKNIKDLLDVDYDIEVKGITDDSRDVREGFIFVATKGFNVDHFDFIDKAIENGCVFLVVDREISMDFPHIIVENIDKAYQKLCIKYYDLDLEKFHFIGITGTDGKTTTTSIVSEILDNCAYMGTNGLKVLDEVIPTNNTTPCLSEMCKDMNIVQEKNVSTLAMEVSSEALLHGRVNHLLFDIVGFTNITEDHLNVHKTLENYIQCKLHLLDFVKENGYVIVNGDDKNLQKIKCKNLVTFGFNNSNDYVIHDVKLLSKKVSINVKYKDKNYLIDSPLIGRHNVYNVVMAFIIGIYYGVEEEVLIDRISKLKPIPGRCEFLDFGQDYDIVLDYAHTINGIDTILDTFKDYKEIITVTGAAGGREKEKRSTIGDIVIRKSTKAIFTMDDPRYEDVDDIIDQMVSNHSNYIRIKDREEAIHYALGIAHKGSVVLILGKGRDNYMAIEDKKIEYNDYNVIKNYFEK